MSQEKFEIVREIGIDAAHRVPLHGSKCRNLHGHRYTIEAHCSGPLTETGEQTSMVLDFGFLKDEMMNKIDALCDHATILWVHDPLVWLLVPAIDLAAAINCVASDGYCFVKANTPVDRRFVDFKLYLVPFAPTAEELARHWFKMMEHGVSVRSNAQATLTKLVVHETPNCRACYPV